MKILPLLCATALLLSTTTFIASDEVYVMYEDLDLDDNGWLDKQEARERSDLYNNWTSIDLDDDGYISSMEYLRYEGRDGYGLPYESQDMDPGGAPL